MCYGFVPYYAFVAGKSEKSDFFLRDTTRHTTHKKRAKKNAKDDTSGRGRKPRNSIPKTVEDNDVYKRRGMTDAQTEEKNAAWRVFASVRHPLYRDDGAKNKRGCV